MLDMQGRKRRLSSDDIAYSSGEVDQLNYYFYNNYLHFTIFNKTGEQYSNRAFEQASIMDGNYGSKDIVNYGMSVSGLILGGTEAHLRNARSAYAARGTKTAQRVISKIIDPSISRVAKVAKGIGVAGVLLNGTIVGINWYNGEDITASQVADLAIGVGLIAAGGLTIMSAPAALVAVGALWHSRFCWCIRYS